MFSKLTAFVRLFIILLVFSVLPASAADSLQAEIEECSEGTDLIASGYFENGYDTIWLLFDNNVVVVLLRDAELPDVFSTDDRGWLEYAPNVKDIYYFSDYDHDYSFSAPDQVCHHEYTKEILSEATPESDGQELYTCIHCGKQYTLDIYYQDAEVIYTLTAEIDGELVEINISKDSMDEIQIVVGVDYSLVKLSKRYKPVTAIRISRILRLKPKTRAKARAAFMLYAEPPTDITADEIAETYDQNEYVYREEVCTFQATEAGTASVDLDFEDGETHTIKLVAQEAESNIPDTGNTDSDTPPENNTDKPDESPTDDTSINVPTNPTDNTSINTPASPTDDAQVQPESPAISEPVYDIVGYKGAFYQVDRQEKTASLISLANKNSTAFTVPEVIHLEDCDYTVTAIQDKSFADMKKLKTVTIGKNVAVIGSRIFYHCPKLKTIQIKTVLLTKEQLSPSAFSEIKNKKRLTVKVPKKYRKSYKVLLKKSGGIPSRTIFKPSK